MFGDREGRNARRVGRARVILCKKLDSAGIIAHLVGVHQRPFALKKVRQSKENGRSVLHATKFGNGEFTNVDCHSPTLSAGADMLSTTPSSPATHLWLRREHPWLQPRGTPRWLL